MDISVGAADNQRRAIRLFIKLTAISVQYTSHVNSVGVLFCLATYGANIFSSWAFEARCNKFRR